MQVKCRDLGFDKRHNICRCQCLKYLGSKCSLLSQMNSPFFKYLTNEKWQQNYSLYAYSKHSDIFSLHTKQVYFVVSMGM